MPRASFFRGFVVLWSLFLSASAASATTADTAFLRVDGQQLVLRKPFLGRSLVLLPGRIESREPSIPLFWWHVAPLVHFQRGDGVVYLVEEPRAQSWLHSSITTKHLAVFPLRRETTTELYLAMPQANLADRLVAFPDPQAATVANLTLLRPAPPPETGGAYIRSHVARPGWFTMEHVIGTAGAVYRYTWWLADHSTLAPIRDHSDDALGFFPPAVYLGLREREPIIWRWDPVRPLTFYISANTPPHVRPAMRDGALAWNTVLHADFIRVADAPVGTTPGDPRYPMLYWSELPGRSAIAQVQAHPRTGEILNAVVVVQSGWADVTQGDFVETTETTSTLAFGNDAALCDYQPMSPNAAFYGRSGGAFDDATLQRLGLLQLRAVVMHEVGHILGLRHNFAGNLGNEIPPNSDAADFAQLLEGTRPPDAPPPSSSIMDYLPIADAVRMTVPGRYDAAAVAIAYPELAIDAPDSAATPPRFCTDEQVGGIADCQRFDGGTEPIAWWADGVETGIQAYNQWILENVVIPPEQWEQFQPDLVLRGELVGQRIGAGLEALRSYAEGGHTWVLHDHYPFERAAQARAVLHRFAHGPFPGRHAAVRAALAAQLAALETVAPSDTPQGRWAQQVLIHIERELAALPFGAPPILPAAGPHP